MKYDFFSIITSHDHWFLLFPYTSIFFSLNIHFLSPPLKALISRQTIIEHVAVFAENTDGDH